MLDDFFDLGSIVSIMSMMLAAHCFIKECGSSALIGCNSKLFRNRLIISAVTDEDEPFVTASSNASRNSLGILSVILVWSMLVSIGIYYDVKKTHCIDISNMSIIKI